MNTNDQNTQEIIQHKAKLIKTAMRAGSIATLSNIIILLCFISPTIGKFLIWIFLYLVLLAFGSAFIALFAGINFKRVNRKFPEKNEELREKQNSKAEFGIVFGLINLLAVGFLAALVLFSFGSALSAFN